MRPFGRLNLFKINAWDIGWTIKGSVNTTLINIASSDKKNIGTLKLKGTYDLNYYQLKQIKRIRLVKRADGYYVQFAIQVDIKIQTQPTGKIVGLDVGIKYFLADSDGHTVENPEFYRKSESSRGDK